MDERLEYSPPPEYHMRLAALLDRVRYKQWKFNCRIEGSGSLVWATFDCDGERWNTRKWWVSSHVTESEITQTLLLMVLVAEEHEAREAFLVDGRAIYGPHIRHGALADVCHDQEHRGDPS